MNGYSSREDILNYRIIPCDLVGKVSNSFQGEYQITIDATSIDEMTNGKVYHLSVYQSISTIEKLITDTTGEFNYESLPPKIVQQFREMTGNQDLVEAYRRIHLTQLSDILNNTKQKLIDTLLDLNEGFPNLEDDFEPTQEDRERASTIINTNIYGDKVNSNVGVGNEVTQSQKCTDNPKQIENKLDEIRELGVDEQLIDEAREIAKQNEDKKSISKKLMTWIGKVSTKAVEKGIQMNMDIFAEKVQDLIGITSP